MLLLINVTEWCFICCPLQLVLNSYPNAYATAPFNSFITVPSRRLFLLPHARVPACMPPLKSPSHLCCCAWLCEA